MYFLKDAPNEDSNQTVHPHSLIRVFVGHMKKCGILGYPKCIVMIQIRLSEHLGWSDSSLGAHVRKYVIWRYGSYGIVMTNLESHDRP